MYIRGAGQDSNDNTNDIERMCKDEGTGFSRDHKCIHFKTDHKTHTLNAALYCKCGKNGRGNKMGLGKCLISTMKNIMFSFME